MHPFLFFSSLCLTFVDVCVAAKLRGPNQWPDPTVLPHFRSVMQEYYTSMCALGYRVVQLLALSLQLPQDYFHEFFHAHPLATLRLLHYDGSLPSNIQHGRFACGAHSDYGMLTLLWTDHQPGLQVLSKTQEWIPVPPRSDCFVVNLGDMLERWTNGLYRSTVHRVILNPETTALANHNQDRYSIPFFYDPSFDTVVECLATCCDDQDNPPKYAPITSGQHLLDKYLATHQDFAPSSSSS